MTENREKYGKGKCQRMFSLAKHGKLMPIIISVILGATLTGLFVSAYAVPRLKSIFAPHPWSLHPPPAEHELIDVYFNQTSEARGAYLYSGTVQARKFEVKIDSFSKELSLVREDETITAPYSWKETYRSIEGRPCGFGFQIIAPNKSAEYEINLRFIVSNSWLSTREYPQKLVVRVQPMPHKPRPEETLTVTLDKETYRQGDTMTITIQSISNETIWFTDTAYNLVFERFDHVFDDWVFHTAPVAGLTITSLQPEETAQFKWAIGHPFLPGRYRVGTHGVYAEFKVVDTEPSLTELETIIIEFLKTTDVANSGWDGTVKIVEVYDHKLGGKVVVVNYTTANAVHPHFMCEAIEHHTAVITLNEKGEVVSAFCVWGSFHGLDEIWDLANQRWIRKENSFQLNFLFLAIS